MDKLESMMLEAETVSALMIQMADDDVGDTSFAVMSDLGENGTEHECDLGVHETALRASSVIDQLLAELEAKDGQNKLLMREIEHGKKLRVNMQNNADSLSERIAELEVGHQEAAKQIASWRRIAKQNIEEREKDLVALDAERQKITGLEAIRADASQVFKEIGNELGCNPDNESIMMAIDELKKRLATPVRSPDDGLDDCRDMWPSDCSDDFDTGYKFGLWRYEQNIRAAGFTVEGDE